MVALAALPSAMFRRDDVHLARCRKTSGPQFLLEHFYEVMAMLFL